jgi:Ras-related C3 botulinum toxin substrate 1
MADQDEIKVKCVVVGDGAVGKTSLLMSYGKDSFPVEYVPTVFDNYSATVEVGGKAVNLSLWDTAGQEDYDRLRPLSYPGTDVFMVCYSMTDPQSFKNAQKKWITELGDHAKSAPIILVGTKMDLAKNESYCEENSITPIKEEEGAEASARLSLYAHVPTSALTQENLKTCFDEAIIAVLK